MNKALCRVLIIAAVLMGSAPSGHGSGAYHHGGGTGGAVVYHGGGWGGAVYRGGGWGYRGSVWVGPGWGYWGPGWGAGWYWPPAYPYYYAPPVVIEQQPQLYVQPAPQQEEQGYWYYCPDPQGYYPYVNACPKGWLKVVPSPAPSDKGE